MIRLTIPSLEEDDFRAVRQVLETGYLVQGTKVAEFEEAVANYLGAKYAVAVSNCTAALHLALLALDTRPGDIILVTTYSWPATANVIELCGAQPVFVDIQADTFNMNPAHLADTLARLMANPDTARRVKAVLPVHTFGQMAEMPAILEIADRHGLPVIEDAACALGAALNGRQAGSWGVMGCFSFHPRKAITTGEGGIIVTNHSSLFHHLRALRNHGQDPDAAAVDFIMPGFNYRLTEFQAALGISQMGKLDRVVAARRQRATVYDDLLAETPLQAPIISPGNEPVYQSYVALLPETVAGRRSAIIQSLNQEDIQTTIGTYHMPLTTYFRTRYGYQPGNFPVTDKIFAASLTLPLFEEMTGEQQKRVIHRLTNLVHTFSIA